MKINSDINILGGMPDMNIILAVHSRTMSQMRQDGGIQSFTAIKTEKSVVRFRKAIYHSVLKFYSKDVDLLINTVLLKEAISPNSLYLLFWNASFNNDLLNLLNHAVFFPAFYSGRITVKQDEVSACIGELRASESVIQGWSDSTIEITASKYLTLLKKFGLMEGGQNKTIVHPYLDDMMLMLFIYWLKAIEPKSNILESAWLEYCFSEQQVFVERIMQKKYSKFIHLNYTGDNLKIELTEPYENIYHALSQS